MGRKSCFNCVHGSKLFHEGAYGDGFLKPYLIACTQVKDMDDMGTRYHWNEYHLPDVCGQYEPKMVLLCTYCNTEMNAAEYIWHLWAGIEGKPVCSPDCRIKLEAREIGSLFYD